MARTKPQKPKKEPVEEYDSIEVKEEPLASGLPGDETISAHVAAVKKEGSASATTSRSPTPAKIKPSRSPSTSSLSRIKLQPSEVAKTEEQNGSVSPVKSEPSKPAKMGRAHSSKGPPPRIAPLFDHLPDVTTEATSSFAVITSSTYQNKYLGFTESALECDCSEEWGMCPSDLTIQMLTKDRFVGQD